MAKMRLEFASAKREEVRMKLHYYEDTDSLYINLSTRTSADSREISDGVVVDYDTAGQVVGIDMQHASERLDLSTVETAHLPVFARRIA
jgi:uncharacterized protein YuzE